MIKDLVPSVHFYNQDFVDLYDRSWVWIGELWKQCTDSEGRKKEGFPEHYLSYAGQKTFHQFYSLLSSFFLVYGNSNYTPYEEIDFYYSKQEGSGAIRAEYDVETGEAVRPEDNPEGFMLPLFAWVEFSLFHKSGNKKRLKDVVVPLEKYFGWLKEVAEKENGLYSVPSAACMTGNVPRPGCAYPVDFNAALALNALYMSAIGDILNDKEMSFRYKRLYFSLKTKINSMMWDPEDNFYYDLDKDGNRIKETRHIGAYWTLLAEIPNEEKADALIAQLKDPEEFGTEDPFPCVPASSKYFSETGNGYCGSVIPFYTFLVVKGLTNYGEFVFAHECSLRHMFFILEVLSGDGGPGDVWEAYLPNNEGLPRWKDHPEFPRKRFLPQVGLITIALMIENIIGLDISLPRKTVNWTMQKLDQMGIENFSLKRNMISIQCNKNLRGWEIRLESEKLYYFTIRLLDDNKTKTLPIPSGKCSLLISKI